jgi:hypothetical protein
MADFPNPAITRVPGAPSRAADMTWTPSIIPTPYTDAAVTRGAAASGPTPVPSKGQLWPRGR